MAETIKVLFFGDLVGKPGRFAVRDFLANEKSSSIDFVVANVENASHGFGLTKKNYHDLSEYGLDCMTGGNHIWDKREILDYIENADKLVRPFNYPKNSLGVGSRIFDCNGVKIGVINALGRVFLPPLDSPWDGVVEEIKRIKEITPIILLDFHAEATAEKICFGRYCSELGLSAFFGTHTHVQTADENILNNMAYISDVGFCGASESVIGMDYNTSLNRFLTCMPERYEVANSGNYQINAVEVEIEVATGHAIAIKRILSSSNEIAKEKDDEV